MAEQTPDTAPAGIADFEPSEAAPEAQGWIATFAYALGGFGLLMATAADSLAVAGRHTGLPILGSIELVQIAVIMLASSAMLIATMTGGHASVHIVTERLSALRKVQFARVAALLSAAIFLVLAVGSIWLLTELWNGSERTELLHVPLRWLRLVWIGFALLIAGHFLMQALRSVR